MNKQMDKQAQRMAANVFFVTGFYQKARELYSKVGMVAEVVTCDFMLNEIRIANHIYNANVNLITIAKEKGMTEHDFQVVYKSTVERILFTTNLN